MTIKVIGAGFGRTGTLSLKYALEYLGFKKCYHMTEILKRHPEHVKIWMDASDGKPVDWPALFSRYQATVDFPGCLFYKELLQQYPEAKVILTYRDPDRWYSSTQKTIYAQKTKASPSGHSTRSLLSRLSKKTSDPQELGNLQDYLLWEGIFNGRFEDKDFAIDVYQKHLDQVKEVVPSDQLLVFHVKEGWTPICKFLGVPVPINKPFPHLNPRQQFTRRRWPGLKIIKRKIY